MDNALFVVSPLYLGVGVLVAVLIVQEYFRGLPSRHASHRGHHHHRHHRPAR